METEKFHDLAKQSLRGRIPVSHFRAAAVDQLMKCGALHASTSLEWQRICQLSTVSDERIRAIIDKSSCSSPDRLTPVDTSISAPSKHDTTRGAHFNALRINAPICVEVNTTDSSIGRNVLILFPDRGTNSCDFYFAGVGGQLLWMHLVTS